MSLRSIIAIAASLASVNAHMNLQSPVPFKKAQFDNGPITAADFPCKMGGVYTIATMNNMTVGEKQKLEFKGSATHRGGSCQLSITTDTKPTADSVFKVIKTMEGGCPGVDGAETYDFEVPPVVPTGEGVFAWTWFAKESGAPEMYMECAPATFSGGASDRSGFDALPDMLVANIATSSCKSPTSKNLKIPNPGENVVQGGNAADTVDGTGDCGASSGGSTPAQPSSPDAQAPPAPAGQYPAQPSGVTAPSAPPASPSNPGGAYGPGAPGAPAGTPTTLATVTGTSAASKPSVPVATGTGSPAAPGTSAPAASGTGAAAPAKPSPPAAPPSNPSGAYGSGALGAPAGTSTTLATVTGTPAASKPSVPVATGTGSPAAPGTGGAAPAKPSPPAAPGTGYPAAPASSPAPSSPTNGGASGTRCSPLDKPVCNGEKQFGVCDNGIMVFRDVSEGTTCRDGVVSKRSFISRIARGRYMNANVAAS